LRTRINYLLLIWSFLIQNGSLSYGQVDKWPKVERNRLDTLIWAALNTYEMPGVQVVLFSKNKINYSFSGGIRHINKFGSINESTSFELASFSKPVFHFIVFRLIEKGRLPKSFWNDSIINYIDTLKPFISLREPQARTLADFLKFNQNYPEEWFKKLTVRQLLIHKGGLGDWQSNKPAFNIDPDQKFEYCDECYILLQRVIENYLQQSLQELATQYLPKSCSGVSHFVWNPKLTNYAFGHQSNMDLKRDIWKSQDGLSNGTLISSAKDYSTFVQEVIKRKVWIHSSDSVFVQDSLYWKPGWGIEISPKGPLYWHWGNDGCYQNYICYLPSMDLGLVILTNSENGLYFCQNMANQLFKFKSKGLCWVLGN